jgi:hypothetical protein
MSDQSPPAGWYPDRSANAPAGQQRYWDGSAWTERTTAPATEPTTVQPTGAEPAVAEPAPKSSVFARWGIPALVGVVAFLLGLSVGGVSGGGVGGDDR